MWQWTTRWLLRINDQRIPPKKEVRKHRTMLRDTFVFRFFSLQFRHYIYILLFWKVHLFVNMWCILDLAIQYIVNRFSQRRWASHHSTVIDIYREIDLTIKYSKKCYLHVYSIKMILSDVIPGRQRATANRANKMFATWKHAKKIYSETDWQWLLPWLWFYYAQNSCILHFNSVDLGCPVSSRIAILHHDVKIAIIFMNIIIIIRTVVSH